MACPCELQPLPPVYQKSCIENMTVVRPPMLKLYFWESFDISGYVTDILAKSPSSCSKSIINSLNKKLKSNKKELQHTIVVPTRQINSQPQKVILWLRNHSSKELQMQLRRVKNCQCQPLQTRVGFNQFRQLYHCPHRRLIWIAEELLKFKPDELLPLSITINFFLYGDHYLSFEASFSDGRVLMLHFLLIVSTFDPEKTLLTKELIPINIRKFERLTQPIWVRNVTMTHLTFVFSSPDHNLKLHNPNLTVPRQSVWPLMVEYRPNNYENEIELHMNYEAMCTEFRIKARGVLSVEPEVTDMPLKEKECNDFLYVIYPNRLDYDICLQEARTQIVNVHNYSQKCMEFQWQNYVINEFFAVSYEPQTFRLKGHHSKICVIKVTVFERYLHFRRIPIVLEVHRVLDRATRIAKNELEEIESIDDPKWKEDSYVEHLFLQLNIKSDKENFFDEEEELICDPPEEESEVGAGGDNVAVVGVEGIIDEVIEPPPPPPTKEELNAATIKRLAHKMKLTATEIIELSMAIDQRVTIFEKLYWKYLSKSNFMRINEDRTKRHPHKTYEMVINPNEEASSENPCDVDRNNILEIISRLMVEAMRDLSKNWLFIPSQYYERLS